MIARPRAPQLEEWMVVYFGEDWRDDFGSEEAAIRQLVEDAGVGARHRGVDEIRALAGAHPEPAAFEAAFAELSPMYRPQGGPWPFRAFAERLRHALEASLTS